ncbi:hypothetical protein M2349_002387 [Caldanaerobacter subterraneus subsp. tengcongensis MB4]|uniref:Uncharacterized protein n=1 Tax=Caldanaerobacter subterraneus subsp. pacificus DSM 12653 TaxID=391606 RepID=A0A0F5PJI3_9THEO|nr:hypothetical protein CDSM653_02464 [Caldanaerobacter subterraneus subsp. pacificus DSM 12653]MCS3917246.1 hypothetical protein [Caldanaerobacter subterraneus subsp. tengcongensis MB4]
MEEFKYLKLPVVNFIFEELLKNKLINCIALL